MGTRPETVNDKQPVPGGTGENVRPSILEDCSAVNWATLRTACYSDNLPAECIYSDLHRAMGDLKLKLIVTGRHCFESLHP